MTKIHDHHGRPANAVARGNETERVLEAKHLTRLQKTLEDGVVKARSGKEQEFVGLIQGKQALGNKGNDPQLPKPLIDFKQFLTNPQVGLTTLIGYVMSLEQNVASQFYQSQLQQGTMALSQELTMSQVIGKQTLASYDAQQQEEYTQSDQTKGEGRSGLIAFGVTVGMGAFLTYKGAGDETEQTEAELKALKTPENDPAAAAATRTAATQEERLQLQANEAGEDTLTNETKGFKNKAKRLFSTIKDKLGKKGMDAFTKSIQNAVQASQLVQGGSQSITQLTITAPAQRKLGDLKGQEGEATAASKVAEQYSQFWGQFYSRTEDQRTSTQQFIDFIINLYKSEVDTINQTNAKIFS